MLVVSLVIYECSISSSAELVPKFSNAVLILTMSVHVLGGGLDQAICVGSDEARDVGDGPAARIAVGLPR